MTFNRMTNSYVAAKNIHFYEQWTEFYEIWLYQILGVT
jgi:hypothetical protein